MARETIDLPIDPLLPEVVETLRSHAGLVIEAPPGAGKSTRVPPAILDAELAGDDRIVMLEPRRVAARATARRIADERAVALGGEVGYQVRFDRKISSETRLSVITEGILTRRLQSDPFLEDIGVVILDEFHERSRHTDLAIAFLKEVQEVRDDLKVVVMSATLEAEPIADYLDVPSLKSEGRTYPVDIEYLDKPPEDRVEYEAARQVRGYVGSERDDGGDILIFLPGRGEIHRCLDSLEDWARGRDLELLPLYGALSSSEQDRALRSGGPRKIIASTNIAETSVTIEGVTLVIDSGKVRQMRMSEASGVDNLETVHVSLASAKQRAGRAGRVQKGRAIRLWTHAYEHRLDDYDEPEISRIDLAPVLLEVIAWSGADPRDFDWFDAPPDHAIRHGVDLLEMLGAVDAGQYQLTELGKRLLELPVHPRIGRMLVEGERRGVAGLAATMAAIISERDFVNGVDRDAPGGRSDVLVRADFLNEVASGRKQAARRLGFDVHVGGARRLKKVVGQLKNMVDQHSRGGSEDDALRSVLAGYPDRIAMRRREGDDKFVMVGGEPMTLAYESVVRDARFIVAPVVAGKTRARSAVGGVDARALIRLASEVKLEWLREEFPERFEDVVEVAFDEDKERVTARKFEEFDGLVLDEQIVSVDQGADPEEVTAMLMEHALEDVPRAFDLSKDDHQYLIRWACARQWFPEADFPRLMIDEQRGNPDCEIWGQLLWGKRSFAGLRRMSLPSQLGAYVTGEQRKILDEALPQRIEVPSGSNIRLKYQIDDPPILAVRIQEVFGWTETPRVARGRQQVLMHLLAPNFRPAQVTDDLAGFWERTYPEVRKELRARYSKHPWPEDPVEATAVYK